MEYLGGYFNDGPVILDQRPYRNPHRHASEHHNRLYIQDANGLLVPAQTTGAGVRRSNSYSGPKITPIVINNNQWDDRSPERKRRSYQDRYHSPSDEYDDRSYSRERRQSRSRSRGRHHKHKSQTPSPDPEMGRKLQRLEELEQREKEEAARQKFEEERIVEEARKAKEAKELEALKELTIKEHSAKLLEEEMKKKKKKEEEDKAFRERMRDTLTKAGYSEESIEQTLKGKGDKSKKIMDLTRPTYIKVHRKHLSPDTLDIYDLPWEWDDRDSEYIIIKRWIPEHDQDVLFEHTRKLREGRLLTNASVEIKKERDKLLMVRKKSPSRRRSHSRGRIIFA